MKNFFLILPILLLSFTLKAQSPVSISNVHTSYKDFTGFPQGYPLNDSTQVTLTVSVNNPERIDMLTLKMGTSHSKGDLLNKSVKYIEKNGKKYLDMEGNWGEIVHGTATFQFVIPKNQVKKGHYVSIEGKDKEGKHLQKKEVKVK